MVVAMTDQRFLVYERKLRGTDKRHPIPTAQTKLGFVPYDISIVEDGAAILSGIDAGPRALYLVDLQGHEQWKANIDFAVEAPPIDGGDGRVYVVGKGIAAFEDGKTLWSQPSSASVHATSLSDGSLLVTVSAELRVVARDGTIKQTLKVPEGDALVAPPAVTADGTVWLATAKALYVAR